MVKDGYEWLCLRFMAYLRREFRGEKAEISPHILTKKVKLFCHNMTRAGFTIDSPTLLDALIRRNWLEPSATNTYRLYYDAMMKK